jgi:hypothetical protein
MARQIEGGRFRDPYLRYVYPDERLPGAPGGEPLTYRQVDGYVILALIGRAGDAPEPLVGDVIRAETALRAAARAWRGAGFSNTIRAPRADGVALDTFCMVGWLLGDPTMAREAAGVIEGDRWLPPGWYEEGEAFRALADESWCVRFLTSGPVASEARELPRAARPVLERLASEFRSRAVEAPAATGTFYEALHVGMVLAEAGSAAPARIVGSAGGAGPPLAEVVLAVLRRWAGDHAGPSEPDVLEWANLAASEILRASGEAGRPLREQAISVLLDRQEDDGCWAIPGAKPPDTASGFATLRALLALQAYRADRERDGARSSKPAPYATMPAQ